MLNYIIYRVFSYFNESDKSLSRFKTIGFLTLFQISLMVPMFILINIFIRIEPQLLIKSNVYKYFIGIVLILLMSINGVLFAGKLKEESLVAIREKYYRDKYVIPIWIILVAPVFFVFVCPIIYGIINGTIHISPAK